MAKLRTTGKSVVGLDIEPGYVAAAQVSVNGAIAVERAATAPLPAEVMRDGEVADADALAATLKELWSAHKLPRRVRLGVANQRIVVRTIDLPPLSDAKDLAAALRFQAQEHIPMPLEQAVLDYHSLGRVQTPEGERTRVVLVAARRDMVDRLLAAARGAGLRPEGIDLSAFAMIRALDSGTFDEAEGGLLYVNVAGMTNLAIARSTTCLFTRAAQGGTEAMVAQLAERRGLTLDHSRQWLAHVGLTTPLDQIEGEPEIVSEARSVLADGARRVADEIRNSLDFYRAQDGAILVSRAVLTGPAVGIAGFCEQLSADVGLPVEPRVVREATPGALDGIDAGLVTVAAGLAARERP